MFFENVPKSKIFIDFFFWIQIFLPVLHSLFLFFSYNSVSPQDKGSKIFSSLLCEMYGQIQGIERRRSVSTVWTVVHGSHS